MIKTILFDLDGTLLPMDQDKFTKAYMSAIAAKLAPYGFNPSDVIAYIWNGVLSMVKNDGSRTNEEVFWDSFYKSLGENKIDKSIFDEFYENDFPKISTSCGFTDKANQLISELKANGYKLILATNPIFPAVATYCRINWAGLEQKDFEYITTYENCHYCKPNTNYYNEILDNLKLNPSECLMVGNDVSEDMVAKQLGLKTFLLTDCIINKNNIDISMYPHGSFEELKKFIGTL